MTTFDVFDPTAMSPLDPNGVLSSVAVITGGYRFTLTGATTGAALFRMPLPDGFDQNLPWDMLVRMEILSSLIGGGFGQCDCGLGFEFSDGTVKWAGIRQDVGGTWAALTTGVATAYQGADDEFYGQIKSRGYSVNCTNIAAILDSSNVHQERVLSQDGLLKTIWYLIL